MARIKEKLAVMLKALETLRKSIAVLQKYAQDHAKPTSMEEEIGLMLQDSVIQRFEYCTDLLWKNLKTYLEEIEKVTLAANTPASIIRAAVEGRIITEAEGEHCMAMIKERNLTSHIYRQEIAQRIISKVPAYYDLQKSIVNRLEEKSAARPL